MTTTGRPMPLTTRMRPTTALAGGLLASALLALAACGGDRAPDPRDPGDSGDPGATGAVRGTAAGPSTAASEGRTGPPAAMEGMQEMRSDGRAGPTVRLRPGQAERIGLRWGVAAREPIVRTLRTSAVVEYPESEMLWVSPKVSGWVEKLHVTFEGAPVRAGQPLVDLYSPELVTAQEELLLAGRLDRTLAAATDSSERRPGTLERVARRRLEYWDISDAQIRQLQETGEVRKTLTLHAPATGVVTRKRAFEGQGVKAGENLFMIAPTDPVWIEVAVHEQDLPFVREGLPAEVSVEGLPGETVRGGVAYVYPELRESTRTVVARIEVPNPRGRLRPGMYATVRIENRTAPVLSVPASALLHTGTRAVAFMDMGRNRLMPMVVETGRAGDDRVEVLSGLEAGDRVATSAQFLLDSEANLMEAMRAMMAEMGRVDMEGTGGMEMDDMEMEGR